MPLIYIVIHNALYHHRTDDTFLQDFLEAQEKNVIHINGVGNLGLYRDYSKMDRTQTGKIFNVSTVEKLKIWH